MKNFKLYLLQIIGAIIIVEIILQLIGFMDTYSEMIGNGYYSYYGQKKDSWYHSWKPNSTVDFKQPEFHFVNQYNNLGFRDKDWVKTKPDSIKRLIVLGDSFTEGDGAVRDSAFPSFLERTLKNNNRNWEVYNGGVCGNDPVYNYQFFKTQINPYYQYDNLMLLFNSSEFDDLIYRGGVERFLSDSTTQYKDGPWFEIIYRYSRISRVALHLLGYNEVFLKESEHTELKTKQLEYFTTLYKDIDVMCKINNKKMLVVIHLFPSELGNEVCNNLLLYRLAKKLENNKVPHIFICEPMQNAYKKLPYESHSWPINGHFNGKGYQILSDVIYEETLKKYPDFFVN